MTALIRRHPLSAFFTLAFGLSWLAWTPYILSGNGLGILPFAFPALLGTAQLLGVLPGAFLGPLTAAFVVTAVVEGRPGLARWGRRLVRWRVSWRWYLVVLLGVPGVLIGTTMLLPAAWGEVAFPGWILLALYLPMLVLQFVTTATAEEPGWRDFALPRLQDRFGAFLGTVVLGTLWGLWHLPLFWSEWGGHPGVDPLAPLEFVAGCIPLSIVMTWVFNKTGQSLPLVMVLHASVNATYSSVWSDIFPTLDVDRDPLHVQLIATTAVALVLLVATRGRLGLRGPRPPNGPTEGPTDGLADDSTARTGAAASVR
jgi:membrane protease YdiL (CAAX protease family)